MGQKILVLEDEKDVGPLYVKCLKDHGYEAELATDGLEGVKKLKSMVPDLILLDLGMPKMNGIEFYQYICDSKGKPEYPVLVLTGRTDLETLFNDLHVDGFIIKPFRPSQLLTEIEIILNKHYQRKLDDHAKSIFIVDDNKVSSQELMKEFSKAGYKSRIAESGMVGIERIMAEPPDIAVVSLNLADIPGDLVILRLQGMAKTKHIKYVLYLQKNFTLDKVVMENFSHKSGVKLMCQYADPAEILEATVKILKEMEQEN